MGDVVIFEVSPVHDFVFTFTGHWSGRHVSRARRRPGGHGASGAGLALLKLLLDLSGLLGVLRVLRLSLGAGGVDEVGIVVGDTLTG